MKCWGLNYADGSRTAGLKAFLDGPLGLSLGVCVCVYLLFLPLSGRCSSPPASYLRPEGDGSMTVPQSNHIHNHSKRKKRETSKERLGHQRLVEACWLLGTSALGDWMIGPYLKVRAFFHPLFGGGGAAGPDEHLHQDQFSNGPGQEAAVISGQRHCCYYSMVLTPITSPFTTNRHQQRERWPAFTPHPPGPRRR